MSAKDARHDPNRRSILLIERLFLSFFSATADTTHQLWSQPTSFLDKSRRPWPDARSPAMIGLSRKSNIDAPPDRSWPAGKARILREGTAKWHTPKYGVSQRGPHGEHAPLAIATQPVQPNFCIRRSVRLRSCQPRLQADWGTRTIAKNAKHAFSKPNRSACRPIYVETYDLDRTQRHIGPSKADRVSRTNDDRKPPDIHSDLR